MLGQNKNVLKIQGKTGSAKKLRIYIYIYENPAT
jgi:hypothetical protein